jgi:hypothetical protein
LREINRQRENEVEERERGDIQGVWWDIYRHWGVREGEIDNVLSETYKFNKHFEDS